MGAGGLGAARRDVPQPDPRRRARLAAAGQWAANWVITVTFPGLREHLGIAYGFYGLCAVLSGLFVWRWVMETKGVSLEDMHGEILHHETPKAAT